MQLNHPFCIVLQEYNVNTWCFTITIHPIKNDMGSWHFEGHFTHDTRLRARDHCTSSPLIGGEAEPVKFASHYVWGTNGVCQCKMDVKWPWNPGREMAKVFRAFWVPGTLSMSSPLTIEFCNFHPRISTVMGKVACLSVRWISGSGKVASQPSVCLSSSLSVWQTNIRSYAASSFSCRDDDLSYFSPIFLIIFTSAPSQCSFWDLTAHLARIWSVLRSCMLCHASLASSIGPCSLNLLRFRDWIVLFFFVPLRNLE